MHAPVVYLFIRVKPINPFAFLMVTVWRTNRAGLRAETSIAPAAYLCLGVWVYFEDNSIVFHEPAKQEASCQQLLRIHLPGFGPVR